jgi:TonB family protein
MIFACVLAGASIAAAQTRSLEPCQAKNVDPNVMMPHATEANQNPPKRIRVSPAVADRRLLCATLIPLYPPEAKAKHLEGTVVLKALIGSDGAIKTLTPLSGDPVFVEPAIRAVKDWRYRPYKIKGISVEIETEITVNFTIERPLAPAKQNSQPAPPTGN